MQAPHYLLDTNCLLWFQNGVNKITDLAMLAIQEPANKISYSQISLWEIAVKQSIGKLPEFEAELSDIILQSNEDSFELLPIRNTHIEAYKNVPLFSDHRDPFDRLLIATAWVEGATIITADRKFDRYSSIIPILW